MSIPIIGDVLNLIGSAVDKIWPDATGKQEAKFQIQALVLQQAMAEKKLLFEDTAGARDLFRAELEADKAPKWTRAIQVLARPFTMYSMVTMYVFNKLSPLFHGPHIDLTEWDYYLMGTIFVFLFGARTLEKMKRAA